MRLVWGGVFGVFNPGTTTPSLEAKDFVDCIVLPDSLGLSQDVSLLVKSRGLVSWLRATRAQATQRCSGCMGASNNLGFRV